MPWDDDWHESQRRLAERATEAFKRFSARFSALTPQQRFRWLIGRGLIDASGNLTTRCGGDAEPIVLDAESFDAFMADDGPVTPEQVAAFVKGR